MCSHIQKTYLNIMFIHHIINHQHCAELLMSTHCAESAMSTHCAESAMSTHCAELPMSTHCVELPMYQSMMEGAPQEDLDFAGKIYTVRFRPYALLTLRSGVMKAASEHRPDIKDYSKNMTLAGVRFMRHILSFSGSASVHDTSIRELHLHFDTHGEFILHAIHEYINHFSKLLDGGAQIQFARNDALIVFNFVKEVVLNHDQIAQGTYIPVIQIAPSFGAYHDRIQVNLIKRAINIIFTVFEMNIRASCTHAAKARMSYVERVQEGYCSTCAYSYDKTKYERLATYQQEHVALLIFAAPHKHLLYNENPEMHDRIILPKYAKILKGRLIDDAKLTIKFASGGHFIAAHDKCIAPTVMTVNLLGSISISSNMVIACIRYAIKPSDQHGKLMKLHTSFGR